MGRRCKVGSAVPRKSVIMRGWRKHYALDGRREWALGADGVGNVSMRCEAVALALGGALCAGLHAG